MKKLNPSLDDQQEFIADLRLSFNNNERERITSKYSPSDVESLLMAIENTLIQQNRDSIKPAFNGSIKYAK